MRKTIIHIIVFLWAGFFLTAGLGINIKKYCCNFCEHKGPESIAQRLYDIAKQPIRSNIKLNAHEDTCCSFKRYQVDIPTLFCALQTNTAQKITIIPYSVSSSLYTNDSVLNQDPIHPPPKVSLLKAGRRILVLKSVLLI